MNSNKTLYQWFDSKLTYKYLKQNSEKNVVTDHQISQIWTPNIDFKIEQRSAQSTNKQRIFIERVSDPKMSGGTEFLNVSETYSGSETPIVISSEHNMQFFCNFESIKDYPFETQVCYMYFYISGSENERMEIMTELKTPPPKIIGQYIIKGWNLTNNLTFQDSSKKVVRISLFLTRRLLSLMMVTYFPTIIMNILNQATLYIIVENKYDIIINVNVTSLMVLVSIYLSVSGSLPSTPSIKPVEIWLLFNLSFPFIVIIENVVLQVSCFFFLILFI